jgi:hypothetical protein
MGRRTFVVDWQDGQEMRLFDFVVVGGWFCCSPSSQRHSNGTSWMVCDKTALGVKSGVNGRDKRRAI